MSDPEENDLGARIRQAQEARQPKKKKIEKPGEVPVNTASLAIRYGSELAANVIVGLLFGLGIDYFFKTRPWGTLIMLGFGLAAGILGVIRAYKHINAEIAAAATSAENKD